MHSGTVSIFNDINGKGFIVPDDGSERIRVSYRAIIKSGYKILYEGQRVSYDMQKLKNGQISATNVILSNKWPESENMLNGA
jgi:CspA family cold shock protein